METLQDYKVELNIYSGPLDLLLYLIKKNEVRIYDIPIARITEQYLQYIDLLRILNINITSEFLVIAATLMQIKSHSLLPIDKDNEEEDDPKFELIKQLLEYKRFKEMAFVLEKKAEDAGKRFSRPKQYIEEGSDGPIELELSDINLWDLLEKFSNLIKQTLGDKPSLISDNDRPISEYMDELMNRVKDASRIYFNDLLTDLNDRIRIVGLFLAVLELVRLKKITVEQDINFDVIKIRRNL